MIRTLHNRLKRIEDGGKGKRKLLVVFIGYTPGEADRKYEEYVKLTGRRPDHAFIMNLGGREKPD